MIFLALILCLLLTAVAALGVVSPSRLTGTLRKAQTRGGLILVAAVRVVLGVALVFSAPESRAPGLIAFIGVVALLKGLALPLMGVERWRRSVNWWSARSSSLLRGWSLLAVAIGLFVAYAIFP
jgi:hypothetical protein